jgi:hypothetical protein
MSVDPDSLPRLFHGGVAGLRPGELIVPHPPRSVDGCAVCAARGRREDYVVPGLGVVDPPTARPDRVYVTSDREYARYYASAAWLGDLYVVRLVGEVEESDEDPFASWCAEAAEVVSVYSRCVQLTMAQRRRLYARWGVADAERAVARGG